MAKSYQLVAWTEKGQIKMIPSEVTAFLHAELDTIDGLVDRIRYRTYHERGDIFRINQAYERLAVRLLDPGRIDNAFKQYVHAVQYCLSSNEWKDLVRKYPRLKYSWEGSGLQRSCN